MKLFDVYPLYPITPVRGQGARIFDKKGREYLDFYGGHAVISIGHSHPHYVERIGTQLAKLGFYSNSVLHPLQVQLADLLGQVSGLPDYELFLCNSGAEANENALKLASFARPDSKKVIALKNGFHGRTSAAVNVTDNPKIQALFNQQLDVVIIDQQDEEALLREIRKGDACAVILEVIQGVGGLDRLSDELLQAIAGACAQNDTILIIDEVQSGYGRSGDFFAFQRSGIQPDIISMAKGMGNGFPIGGILINSKKIKASHGLLGTTFGGNHLACAAGLAVLEVIQQEEIMAAIPEKSEQLVAFLQSLPGVRRVKGRGLMLGAEFNFPVKEFRKQLILTQGLFTGSAKDPNVLRLLPPLTITEQDIADFKTKIKAGVDAYLSINSVV